MTVLTETSLIFGRAMRRSLRNPTWIILGLIQPVLYLVLFGPLLKPIVAAPGFPPGDAWQVFVPGLLIMLGIFGGAFVGFELVAEYRAGVIERMRWRRSAGSHCCWAECSGTSSCWSCRP